MNEIEALFVTLGMNLDDASVAKTVNEMTKAVQQKLRSSIYGDKNGAITIPATIEGTYKNGKEIEKEIKDAYAAIYNKAKEMADKSVSLTLDDIKDFRAQINKFGKLTAKKRNNDVIANVNNSLQQSVTAYRELVNDLNKQIQQQKREAAKLNKTQSNTTKRQSTADKNKKYSQKAIDGALNAWTQEMKDREFKKEQDIINKRFIRGISRGTSRGRGAVPGADINLGTRSPNMDTTFLDKDELKKNDTLGTYHGRNSLMKQAGESNALNRKSPVTRLTATIETIDKMIEASYKRGMAIKRQITDYKGNGEVDVRYEDSMAYRNTPKTSLTEAERLKGLASAILPELAKELGGLQKGRPDASLERFNQLRDTVLNLNETAGMKTINNVMSVLNMSMHKWFNTKGMLGVGDGTNKADETRNNVVEKALKDMVDHLGTLKDKITQETIAIEEATEQRKKSSRPTTRRTRTSGVGENSIANKVISQIAASGKEQSQKLDTVAKTTASQNSTASKHYMQDTYESSREARADSAEGEKNRELIKITTEDAGTGFDTDAKADQAIEAFSSLKGFENLKDMMCPCESVLQSILAELQGITKNGIPTKGTTRGKTKTDEKKNTAELLREAVAPMKQALLSSGAPDIIRSKVSVPDIIRGKAGEANEPPVKTYYEGTDLYREQKRQRILKKDAERINTRSNIPTSSAIVHPKGIFGPLIKAFNDLKPVSRKASDILAMNKEEQSKLQSDLIRKYGLAGGQDGMGDKIRAQRVKSIYNWGGRKAGNPFEDLQLSEGINLDTTKLTENLQNLIEKNMFNAQTGGLLKNLMGPLTLYAGQPSLEKTRAQMEGMNTIMSHIRTTAQTILEDIQEKENVLIGFRDSGQATFDAKGKLVQDSTPNKEATAVFTQLENSKDKLRGVVADTITIDKVTKSVHGNVAAAIRLLGFASPELRKDNVILQNLNAGLDKTGKALKYQTRLGEILGYSFQLMARSIGQMFRNLFAMLNPFNLIKRMFQDFMSYDVKWKRTMNVIKYNLRRIIRPAMEWIAQQLVNIIGLGNALLKGIGKAFGQNWDLFDKSAASAEQMREELEQAANVTAGFDELHDIGGESSSDASLDLMGDIYTPQWDGLYKVLEDIGNVIGKIIDAVSHWNFWDWLIIAGAALAGYLILKWLINIFTGKNPLQAVAKGFSFLEKAVGWAILIWAFTEFTKALTDFVECMKTANWDDVWKSLTMLGGAFVELVASIAGIEAVTKLFGTSTGQTFGLAALVGVFGLFVDAVTPFIELIMKIKKEFPDAEDQFEIIFGALSTLVLAFIDLIGGVAGLEGVTKLIGATGAELLGLGAIVGALSLFVDAITPFIEVIGELGDEKWDAIIGMVGGLVGAFIALAVGVTLVSKLFSAMDWKAILQLGVVAGVFALFTYALVPFLNLMKDIDFDTVINSIILLAGAFVFLAIAVGIIGRAWKGLNLGAFIELIVVIAAFAGIMYLLTSFTEALKDLSSDQLLAGTALLAGTFIVLAGAIAILSNTFKKLSLAEFLELIVLLAAFAGLIWVITEFAKVLKDLSSEQIYAGLIMLAGSIAVIALAVGILAAVFAGLSDTVLGVIGIALLAVVLGAVALIIYALAELVKALGEAGDGIKTICEGIAEVVQVAGEQIQNIIITIGAVVLDILIVLFAGITNLFQTIGDFILNLVTAIGNAICSIIDAVASAIERIGNTICQIVETIANSVMTILQPIMDFLTNIIDKVFELAGVIVHEIGETIRTIIQTVGDIIIAIINAIVNAIPNLLNAILTFCGEIGPAIERSADAIMRTITKIINFTVSAIEYLVNLVIGGVNNIIRGINKIAGVVGIDIPEIPEADIPRFVPQYEVGTNYVPSDGLAYLHQGEAVIPKKYNQPYQPTNNSRLESAIDRLSQQVSQISAKVEDGIPVKGQFIQRGSDLVATVERANNRLSNNILNNKVYAR